MQFVVDPAVLGPPANGKASSWVASIQALSSLVGEAGITATSAKQPCDQMVAQWFSAWESREGLAGFELARMAEEVAGRLRADVPNPKAAPLLDGVSVEPSYVDGRLCPDDQTKFEEHLAEAACAKRDGADQLGVLGVDQSWERVASHILVEGEVIARADLDDDLIEEDAESAAVREFLEHTTSVRDVYSQVFQRPCSLMGALELGIKACWISGFDGDPDELRFAIGSAFAKSVTEMNYAHLGANARKCLRVMTLIAAGRSDELEGHEERTGKGGNNETLRVDGDPVMRAYISNHTPNAHRLFWIRRDTPVLLNVTGHEGRPAI